jgi:hypothetical protein
MSYENRIEAHRARVEREARDLLERGEIDREEARQILAEEAVPKLPRPDKVRKRALSSPRSLSLRAQLAHQGRCEAVRLGAKHGGPTPYGYRLRDGRLEIESDEAEVVLEIFNTYAYGRHVSMGKLARQLLARGVPGKWSSPKIGWILGNTVYLGMSHYGGVVARGNHEPIVTSIVFNLANKRRRDQLRRGRDACRS